MQEMLKGIKVMFINMPLRELAKPNVPPQGPGLLAANLRRHGAEVRIIDLNAYRIKDKLAKEKNLTNGRHLFFGEAGDLITAYLNEYGEQDIIALSGMITTLHWQKFTAQYFRRLLPNTFIVSGGGLATQFGKGIFSWIPELDAVVRGEGDNAIIVLAEDVKKQKESKSLHPEFRGDKIYDGKKNKVVYTGTKPENLDELPFPAWDLLETDVFGNPIMEWYIQTPVWGQAANNSSATPFTMDRSLTTVSSRGCPYACKFCYKGTQGQRVYRSRSAENIVKEAEWLKKIYNIDFLGFPDDNFGVDKKKMLQLPELFKDLNLRWGTHTRLDEADERIYSMAEAGCIYIGFGAESASPSVLTNMGKGGFILKRGTKKIGGYEFPTTMLEGIANCRKSGIHSNCTWIMGYPGETLEDLKTSVAFMMWQRELYTQGLQKGTPEYEIALRSVNTNMFTATAYPGTAMSKDPLIKKAMSENFGITFDHESNPICDDALENYVLELDDATKVLYNKNGEPLYYGAMSMEKFLEARDLVDTGKTEEILNMV
ncbi:hypothetical protein A2996_02135 [Candidatus Campbellbacteria bacterium RIFCSPLOWO2_01_FULL_34_15]|uniref:Uncharacterized protein n=2 Tax=Candidatus Campbelliibacteriota TaxID=1752727 RepID=A0A1F5ELE5_9BACT|nr:MAG: hypothetical protein A2996_02135 [Candidatus Campbellbacteria bacterium RIFCSPLOWO2_01_FULL_34_15]OGD69570.1 MAG: hypothetical protein A2811_01575 [Candidatus Campbellbacteria bacterium RIFCSPHIGHO2_01_FULL_34_10]